MAVPPDTTTGMQNGILGADPRLVSGGDLTETDKDKEIVETLEGYREEAKTNRSGGLNPRDDKWRENENLYWGRYDFSKKADWQAKETMPEVPSFVDRFAAAMKESLVNNNDGFYTVLDPADQERDLADAVKRMTDVWLSRSGRNQTGTFLAFPAVFEEQMKLGALKMCSAAVTWREDAPGGRVAIETVDPNFVWLDHTYRNLYRIRRIEMDRHELIQMAKAKDAKGKAIWKLPALELLGAFINGEDTQTRERSTGEGQQIISHRVPIVLDEYLATVVDRQGNLVGDPNSLFVVANERFLVRGPEKNPYVHGKDWMVTTPLITAPGSVYGRSYMEDLGSVAKTFNELTNMILDAVHTTSLKAFAMVPGYLLNPEQATSGITPNKVFLLEDGIDPKQFATALDMGQLGSDAVTVWQALKTELREAAGINEIGLGQFAPKGRTSATEITETQQSSSALIRSMAQTVETRFLDPILDLTWKTGVQHMKPNDPVLREAAGYELYDALYARRRELIQRTYTFQARGISTLIQRGQMLQRLYQFLGVVGQNEQLLMAFMQAIDVNRLLSYILTLSNIDITRMQPTERQKLIQQITAPLQQAADAAGAQPPAQGPGASEITNTVRSMGLGK